MANRAVTVLRAIAEVTAEAAASRAATAIDRASRREQAVRATDQVEGRPAGHPPTDRASRSTSLTADHTTAARATSGRATTARGSTSHGQTYRTKLSRTVNGRGLTVRTGIAHDQIGRTRVGRATTDHMVNVRAVRPSMPAAHTPRGRHTKRGRIVRFNRIEMPWSGKGRSSLPAAGPSKRRLPRAAMRSGC